MDKMIGTLFRLLCRHLRTIWLRARSLLFSIRLRLLRINPSPSPSPSIAHISRTSAPMPTLPSASRIPAITNFSTARMKACEWACTRARDLKAQMMERRVARKNMMKRMVYARMAARAVGQVKMKEGDGVVATSTYCAKAIEDDEDDEEANEDEEDKEGNRVETRTQGDSNDLDAYEALFKPLSSSPTLRFVASRRSRSPLPPSLSLLSPVSMPGPLTPDLLVPEPRLEVEPRYAFALAHALQSPTISCASSGSGSCDTISGPATPATSQGLTFPFASTRTADDAEAAPVTPRLHLRPNPRPRIRFRTLSASITARSPLSLSFPLSLSLPLSTRRMYSPSAEMNQYMEEQAKLDGDRVTQHGRTGRDVDGEATAGEEQYRQHIRNGEDPFGTHGRAYYAPHARGALGFGDAYDLSAWAWACDYSPYRQEKIHEEKRHVRTGSATTPASPVAGANIGGGRTLMGGIGSGPGSVYSTPIHAASAPQLSYVKCPNEEIEYLRAMAKMAKARGRVERPPPPVRPGPSTVRDPRNQHQQHVPGYRSGIRPLLLPQKLGLPGSGVPVPPREMDKTNNVILSGGRGRRATGWERDLERGVRGEGDGEEA